ncbi:MAG: hypothetical protein R3F59_37865 [Myxococcota bacterium]
MRRIGRVVAAITLGALAGWLARAPTAPVQERTVPLTTAPAEVRRELERHRPAPATAACLDQRATALLLLGVESGLEVPATEPECRAQLALAEAVATERQQHEEGTPEPFLADTRDAYREAAVAAIARAVVETCPELGLTLRRVDCSEYPCMAWFLGGADAGAPVACPAWKDAYGTRSATAGDSLVGPDGQPIQVFGIGPVEPERTEPPPTPAEAEARIACGRGEHTRRLLTRQRNERYDVADEFGAREQTAAEQRQDDIAFWQRIADEGDESAQHMVDMMQAADAEARR